MSRVWLKKEKKYFFTAGTVTLRDFKKKYMTATETRKKGYKRSKEQNNSAAHAF